MVRKETVVVKYTREQRRVVVEHYLTHGRCLSRTARELGYPHPGSLASWVNELLDMFDIRRSLSRKGNPYDNAVVESTNRLLKKELVYRNHCTTIEQPRHDLNDYVWRSDNQRLHSTLGYRSPKEFTKQGLVL